MDNILLFSDSFSIRLILDTYRSDRFTIVTNRLVNINHLNLPHRKFSSVFRSRQDLKCLVWARVQGRRHRVAQGARHVFRAGAGNIEVWRLAEPGR